MSELCQWSVSTIRLSICQLVFQVVVLVFTLTVSSYFNYKTNIFIMNPYQNKLHNNIEDEFLTYSLMLYIER
jgi:hypothetical protein